MAIFKEFTGIDHPAVAADDVDKLAEWYCDVLGFKKKFRHDKPIWIVEAPDGTYVEIMPKDDSPRQERNVLTPGWSHVAFRVNNFEAANAHLDKLGVNWMGEAVEAIGGGTVRSFMDPDGNMLQIVDRS